MSQNENSENKGKKTVEISKVFVDPTTMTLSANVKISGEIKSEDKWSIADASTVVKLVKVPVNDLIVRVVRDWFWVRKIQDQLRKGTIADARGALNTGYDWTETLSRTRVAVKKAPKDILAEMSKDPEAAKAIIASMSAEERAALKEALASL